MPEGGRQMEYLEITAKGSHLTLVLNGTKTVDVQHCPIHGRSDFASIWQS